MQAAVPACRGRPSNQVAGCTRSPTQGPDKARTKSPEIISLTLDSSNGAHEMGPHLLLLRDGAHPPHRAHRRRRGRLAADDRHATARAAAWSKCPASAHSKPVRSPTAPGAHPFARGYSLSWGGEPLPLGCRSEAAEAPCCRPKVALLLPFPTILLPSSIQDAIVKDTQSKVDDWTKDAGAPIGRRRHRAPRASRAMKQGPFWCSLWLGRLRGGRRVRLTPLRAARVTPCPCVPPPQPSPAPPSTYSST